MKILYIANARLPTEKVHGMQIAKMAEAFQRVGHDVELIIPRLSGDSSDDIARFYELELLQPLRIQKIPTWPRRTSRLSFIISSLIFGVLSALYTAGRRGVIYSIDLDYFSFFLLPFIGKHYFFEMHAPKKRTVPHRLLFSRIGGVIATSENNRQALVEAFPNLAEKIMVAPSGGIDAKHYKETPPRTEIKHPAVIYTGSFQGWKGLDTALEAAQLSPNINWYFVGDDAAKLGDSVPENVYTAPWGPASTAGVAWQKGAHMLLLSGTNKDEYSSRFTSPTKTYEYMAAGRPVLAAKTSAIARAVSDKEVFFYEPDSAESLAKAAQYILSHPREAERRTARARKRAFAFTWENRVRMNTDFIAAHV